MDQRESTSSSAAQSRPYTQVFSGERTEFSEDFAEFEQEIEPLKVGVER